MFSTDVNDSDLAFINSVEYWSFHIRGGIFPTGVNNSALASIGFSPIQRVSHRGVIFVTGSLSRERLKPLGIWIWVLVGEVF